MKTHIATHDVSSITIRGQDLVDDLIGKHSFTAMTYFLLKGSFPTDREVRVLDACLVTLMEHGWSPTSIIARLAIDSVPGQAQVGIAAGLLAVGDVHVGTMDGCGTLLIEGIDRADLDEYCRLTVTKYRELRKPLPGFGHPFHKPDDPRVERLFSIAQEAGCSGRYISLLRRLGASLDQSMGRHVTINATGAIAALLLEIQLPQHVMRSVAVISRSAGLAGHLAEEHETRAAREIWKLTDEHIPYEDPA